MIIKIRSLNDDLYFQRMGNIMTIEINGKEVARFIDGEPEDNSLSRNFNDCWSIPSMLKEAYYLGKREQGEVEVVTTKENNIYF